MVYLIAFALTMIFSYIYIKYQKKEFYHSKISQKIIKLLLFLLMCFPLWFISAFRYNVGTDYMYTYVKYYNEILQYGYKPYKKEIIFQFMNDILVFFNLGYQWIFILTSSIIVPLTMYFITKYSTNPLYSILFYFVSAFFFNTLNNVRQHIAIAISLIAFYKDKSWKSLLIIAMSGFIHLSSWVMIPIFLISKINLSKKRMLYLTLSLGLISPLASLAVVKILSHTKYNYFEFSKSGFSVLTVIVNFITYALAIYYYDNDDKEYKSLCVLQLLTVFFCFLSMIIQNEEFWMRVIRMTSIFQLCLIPKMLLKEKNKKYKAIVGIGVLAMNFVFTFYTIYLQGGLEVFPYHFCF